MIYSVKRFIKPSIFVAFVLYGVKVNAQVSLIQNAIDKIEGYKNFSYRCINRQKVATPDTQIMRHKDIFLKKPDDKTFGYLYSMEMLGEDGKSNSTEVYNGQNTMNLHAWDSTYVIRETQAPLTTFSLLGQLSSIKINKQLKIVKAADTTINSIDSYHLIINTFDTVINKEHLYGNYNLFIDKSSGLPICIIYRSRGTGFGDGITNFYDEGDYSDFKFDEDDINIASFGIPDSFRKAKEWVQHLLAPGTVAPSCTLFTA